MTPSTGASTYFTAPSAVFPFAVGAVLYFLRQRGRRVASPLATACAFAAWIANMVAGGAMLPASHIFGLGYLIDTICFAVVVSGLSGLSAGQFGPLAARIDRTLGEWSYFAFLVHWLAGFLVAGAFFSGDWRGWPLLLAVTPVVLAASAALAWLNRISVEPLRSWVPQDHTDRPRLPSGDFARPWRRRGDERQLRDVCCQLPGCVSRLRPRGWFVAIRSAASGGRSTSSTAR